MPITLDGQPVTAVAEQETLQNVLERVSRQCQGPRLVVAVCLNGEELDEEQLEGALGHRVGQDDLIEFHSANRYELVAEALSDLAEHLGQTAEQAGQIADGLLGPHAGDGVNRFAGVLEAWQSCRSTLLNCCRLLSEEPGLVRSIEQAVSQPMAQLVEQLRYLRDAFEARDMVALADLVGYELGPLCARWQSVLLELSEGIRRRALPPS